MGIDTVSLARSRQADTLPRMTGHAHVSFAVKDGATRLATLDQASPLRVLFPRVDVREPPLVAVALVSGGVVAGDRLDLSVAVSAGAKAVAVGQAAKKIYRSTGSDSRIGSSLVAKEGGWLEWLPQETILFDGVRLRRLTCIEVEGSGRILAGEILVFGRLAHGETMHRGYLRDRWMVRRDGRLVWTDCLLLDGDVSSRLGARAGFGGARASAIALYVGPDGERFLDEARVLATSTDGGRAGASCVHGVLVARWLDENPLALRRRFERYWTRMRRAAGDLPARLPRLWHV